MRGAVLCAVAGGRGARQCRRAIDVVDRTRSRGATVGRKPARAGAPGRRGRRPRRSVGCRAVAEPAADHRSRIGGRRHRVPDDGRRSRCRCRAAAASRCRPPPRRCRPRSARADDGMRRLRADLRLAFADLQWAQVRERELTAVRDRLTRAGGGARPPRGCRRRGRLRSAARRARGPERGADLATAVHRSRPRARRCWPASSTAWIRRCRGRRR